MRGAHLHPLGWDAPLRSLRVKFIPVSRDQFARPNERERHQLHGQAGIGPARIDVDYLKQKSPDLPGFQGIFQINRDFSGCNFGGEGGIRSKVPDAICRDQRPRFGERLKEVDERRA